MSLPRHTLVSTNQRVSMGYEIFWIDLHEHQKRFDTIDVAVCYAIGIPYSKRKVGMHGLVIKGSALVADKAIYFFLSQICAVG